MRAKKVIRVYLADICLGRPEKNGDGLLESTIVPSLDIDGSRSR